MISRSGKVRLGLLAYCAFFTASGASPVLAQANSERSVSESPARRIEPPLTRSQQRERLRDGPGHGYRSIDGSENNLDAVDMNAVGTPLYRSVEADYGDGLSTLAGAERPSARAISNLVVDQRELITNSLGTTDFLWQWGQFLDHDIDLTEGVAPPEWAHIAVPAGDAWFDPEGTGTQVIPLNRSLYGHGTGSGEVREQLNEITGWIDASNVYGSDVERAEALRTLDGTGRLRVGPGDLLPFNDAGLSNATGGSPEDMFLAGDVRANEQVGLTAMHTLFVREHNRLAAAIALRDPTLSGEQVYQRARKMVGAQMQVITYREFLPALLGPDPLPAYPGYDPDLDAGIANEFSTAGYRFGHSALSPTLLRLDASLDEIAAGHLPLRNAFFAPGRIIDEGGIEPVLRGLASQEHQRIDPFVIDDVRNFLFGQPGEGGFDLAALNIQRGRDHGLADYNSVRVAYGLPRARSFGDVTRDPEVLQRLTAAYESVDDMDLWVGGLAEDPGPEAHLGPLFSEMLRTQFEALRDGDRFWYERVLSPRERRRVEETRLSDVIRRNTTIGEEIPDDVFNIAARGPRPGPRCGLGFEAVLALLPWAWMRRRA